MIGSAFPENRAGIHELHNTGTTAVDIGGWALTSGVPYVPATMIPGGGWSGDCVELALVQIPTSPALGPDSQFDAFK
jgi:hypothetical protein